MTAVARLHVLISLWFLLCRIATQALAASPSPHAHYMLKRATPIIQHLPNGTITILDPSTDQLIPQGAGTDGGGSGFSPPAMIWLVFLLVVGAPLAVAGIRGWRCTTGAAIGLAGIVCSWAAIINTVNEDGISDLLLTVIVLAFGFLGLIIGIFEFAFGAAMTVLSLSGGLCFGIRVTLLKKDLLISSFGLNWLVIAPFAVLTGLLLLWKRRAAMLLSCASVGTFLTSLGIDLIMNRQSGLSLGLRLLFDRNSNHIAYFVETSYDPQWSTKILLIASLGLTPILALVQHRIFKENFARRGPPPSDAELCLNYPTEDLNAGTRRTAFFSGLWDGAKTKIGANRFSV